MSTALAVYDRITDPVVAMKQLGNAIAKSKMFGCDNVESGEVMAMECIARGMPPLMLAQRFHVIFGKLSMKAEAMLAGFEQAGGTYKVLQRTPDCASIELSIDDKAETFTLTWQDAKGEPFAYDGKESVIVAALASGKVDSLNLKPKYATPRSRSQMLWARVVSDGISVMKPSVKCGTYTPEEIGDFDEFQQPTNGKTKVAAKQPPADAPPADDEPIDVEIVDVAASDPVGTAGAEPADTQSESETSKPAPAVQPANGACTAPQAERIKELWGLLGATPEQREAVLSKRNAKAVRNLTAEQASELLTRLEAAYGKKKIADGLAALPCGAERATAIREKIKLVNQTVPGIAKRIKDKMLAAGLDNFEKLLTNEADELLNALEGGDMEAFFGVAIWPAKREPKN